MNRIFGLLFAAFLLPAAALAAEPPDALIGRVANEVLDKIRADTQLKSGDRVKISEFVNASLMPYVDFPRMTALAVGRNWRLASPEQQQTLMQEFRTLLVRTYSGAVSSVKDQKVRTKPLRAAAGDTDVVVRTEV
ncbi:MAG: ABC transporter substrate-binding protein, partial [Quisquiliibacterium sp.]